MRLADLVGVDQVRVEDVLYGAHSSASSLYHHYGSRDELRATVRSERQRLGILDEDASLLEATATMTSPDEFAAFMAAQLRRTVTDHTGLARRQDRLEALVVGLRNPAIAEESRRLLTFLVEAIRGCIQVAVDRGLCDPDLDIDAYVNLYMTLSLGQLATSSMMDVERWLAVATPAFLAPLSVPRSSPPPEPT